MFLLQFLRTKKYSNVQAFQLLENYLCTRVLYTEWFRYNDEDVQKMMNLYYNAYVYPLIDRDVNGRVNIFYRIKNLDPDRFTCADAFRLQSMFTAVLMENEETQITGINFIIDFGDVNIKILALYKLMELKNFLDVVKNASVGRYKNFYIINVPTYAVFLIDLAKKVLSAKLSGRINILKNFDALKKHFDIKLLPKEFGGDIPEVDHLKSFAEIIKQNKDQMNLIEKNNIIINMIPDHFKTSDCVGSFKKLEID